MPALKLAQLPDRTPVKIPVVVNPELNSALTEYARHYEKIYGKKEDVAELIPYMLQTFMEADRDFAKAQKVARSAASSK